MLLRDTAPSKLKLTHGRANATSRRPANATLHVTLLASHFDVELAFASAPSTYHAILSLRSPPIHHAMRHVNCAFATRASVAREHCTGVAVCQRGEASGDGVCVVRGARAGSVTEPRNTGVEGLEMRAPLVGDWGMPRSPRPSHSHARPEPGPWAARSPSVVVVLLEDWPAPLPIAMTSLNCPGRQTLTRLAIAFACGDNTEKIPCCR